MVGYQLHPTTDQKNEPEGINRSIKMTRCIALGVSRRQWWCLGLASLVPQHNNQQNWMILTPSTGLRNYQRSKNASRIKTANFGLTDGQQHLPDARLRRPGILDGSRDDNFTVVIL